MNWDVGVGPYLARSLNACFKVKDETGVGWGGFWGKGVWGGGRSWRESVCG